MKYFKKLLFLLPENSHKKITLLLLLIIILSLLEIAGVASILPFMTVLATPKTVETNFILNKVYNFMGNFGIKTVDEFIFILGIFFLIVFVASILLKIVVIYVQQRFIMKCEYDISKRIFDTYLQQSYSWFLNRNSSDLGKNILSEVSKLISTVIMPMINLAASSFLAIAMITLLFFIDIKITIFIGSVFAFTYAFIYLCSKNYISRLGDDRLKANQERFTSINEAFGAIKEVKLAGLEKIYLKRFSNSAYSYAHHESTATLIAQLPRYILEIFVFCGILIIIFYLMKQNNSLVDILPVSAVYLLAGYRLMPSFQSIYQAISQLRYAGSTLDVLYNEIKNFQNTIIKRGSNSLPFIKSLSLNKIFYTYPNQSRVALKNITLNIKARTTVGFVGLTGSGKTTIVDLILGLLEPQKGTVEVDGHVINRSNIKDWQGTIGYVPQSIYLSDDSIAANIAFGVEKKNIDLIKVEQVSKIANLHNFVINSLSNQYWTTIGERGVRLSGGQKQRIGIARALYHNPSLLILDEATSALDNITENIVMEAINNVGNNITVIIIAHRLSTVKNCDNIFMIENGELKNQGNYQELAKNDLTFQTMKNNL
jgi:ATP-binding cassette, subfamily B, bacterial PglK